MQTVRIRDALSCQHSENKCRDDVSPYSDALIYKRILDNRLVKSQAALASSLDIHKQTLSEILSFTKIPDELIRIIPNPHLLSTRMALKIVSLIEESRNNLETLVSNASKIGTTFDSAKALERLCLNQISKLQPIDSHLTKTTTKVFTSKSGSNLFSFKLNQNGAPTLTVDKGLSKKLNTDELCIFLAKYLEEKERLGS